MYLPMLIFLVALTSLFYVYMFSSLLLSLCAVRHKKPAWLNFIWYVTKWPALGYICAMPVIEAFADTLDWKTSASFAVNLAIWYLNRNAGDDDDYKKWKKRVQSKVTEVKGRLVVVPVPA